MHGAAAAVHVDRCSQNGHRSKDMELLDPDTGRVRALLHSAGLGTKIIPQSTARTCDLMATDGTEEYLVEVKGLHDDTETSDELNDCGEYSGSREVSTSAALLRRMESAVKQLRDTANGKHESLWVIALVIHGPVWAEIMLNQVLATLYGTGVVADLGSPSSPARKCLYLRQSAFHKLRDSLDAVMVLDRNGAGLFVNDHSERSGRMRLSALGSFFSQRKLLHHAARLESEAHHLIADCDCDRAQEVDVLRYLSAKYGLVRPIALRSFAYVGTWRC